MRYMSFELALMKQHKTSFLADKYNELITMATETVRVLSNHSSLWYRFDFTAQLVSQRFRVCSGPYGNYPQWTRGRFPQWIRGSFPQWIKGEIKGRIMATTFLFLIVVLSYSSVHPSGYGTQCMCMCTPISSHVFVVAMIYQYLRNSHSDLWRWSSYSLTADCSGLASLRVAWQVSSHFSAPHINNSHGVAWWPTNERFRYHTLPPSFHEHQLSWPSFDARKEKPTWGWFLGAQRTAGYIHSPHCISPKC